MIDSFVAAAIHDAKNALLVVDTQLAEAQRQPASADLAGARDRLARIAARLAELLALYRAAQGHLQLAIDDHDLADFLDDVVTEFGPLPSSLSLTIERGPAAQCGAWAFDAYLVRLVLLDALRNARRHAATRITLAVTKPPAGGLAFVVTDDGPGFSPALLAGAEAVSGDGSSGLGLAFARLIATRHAVPGGRHGQLELANRPGACLTLTLP